MLSKYTKQTAPKSNVTFLQVMLTTFLLFFSSILFAAENINTQVDLSQEDRQEETINVLEANSLINAYIVVPIKWVDNAITEVITILIPIKGGAAYSVADAMKDVEEAIKGSNENLQKNKDVVSDALEEANKGLAFQQELMQAQLASPSFQETMRKNQEIMAGINQQFTQKLQQSDPALLVYQYSKEIKEFYGKNPALLRSIFTKVVNSDLADTLKERANQMLAILNSGASNLNYYQMLDLFASVISTGSEVYVICEFGCGVVGGTVGGAVGLLADGTYTCAAGAWWGARLAITECEPICSGLSSIYAARSGVKTGLDNVCFRKGDSNFKGVKTNENNLSVNQIRQQIKRGQAPESVNRIDSGKGNEKEHIHFDNDKHALNIDGTWKHGGKKLTNTEKEWLKNIGWRLPNGE